MHIYTHIYVRIYELRDRKYHLRINLIPMFMSFNVFFISFNYVQGDILRLMNRNPRKNLSFLHLSIGVSVS